MDKQNSYDLLKQQNEQWDSEQDRIFTSEQLKSFDDAIKRNPFKELIDMRDKMYENLKHSSMNESVTQLINACNSGDVVFISETESEKLGSALSQVSEAMDKIGYKLLVLSESMRMALLQFNLDVYKDFEMQETVNSIIMGINLPKLEFPTLSGSFELFDSEPLEIDIDVRISELKRRLKYAKNPMESKNINRELNMLYKQRKGKW